MSYKEEDIVDIYTVEGKFLHKGIILENIPSIWTPPKAIRYIPKKFVDYCLKKGISIELSLVANISKKKRYYRNLISSRQLKTLIYSRIAAILSKQ